jgi:hypothetical protein
VGQRYINHRKTNNSIILFVRKNNKEENVTSPYIYLGEANIVIFEGNKPINIVCNLKNKLHASRVIKAEKAL